MKRLQFLYSFIFLASLHQTMLAQDPFFSQAYLSPVYLNPAAAGSGEFDLRISAVHRRQWTNIPSHFNYSAVSVDKFFPSISSGFGLMATNSTEGYLTKNALYLSYAYTICAGTESVADNGDLPRWFWSGGLQFGMMQGRIDYSKLVFADELNVNGVIPGATSEADFVINNGRIFPDFAAGAYFNYNISGNSRLLAGFSAHHINRPDESLLSTGDTNRSQLPIRWSGNMMYTHTNPQQTWSYSVSFLGYKQAQHNNFQAGIEVTQNQYDISLGIWYRTNSKLTGMNTFGISLAFDLLGRSSTRDKIRAGIAHDAIIGNNGYSYTAGSTEAAIVWDHASYNSNADNPCKPLINTKSACPIKF
jgi:type IX secretion system PorP/SprF family membrane protein